MNPVLVDNKTGILKSIMDKITFISVSGGHESTSAVQFEFIQNISMAEKYKMLGRGMQGNHI